MPNTSTPNPGGGSGLAVKYNGWFRDLVNDRLSAFHKGNEYLRFEDANHTQLFSISDTRNVRINSRNYTQTSGDASAVQIKPNQTVATASITGLEVSPRFASAIDGTNLVGIKCDPVLKGTTGDIGGQVVGVQVNIDFGISGSRTITGDIAAFETFLAIPSSGMTFDALVTVMRVRTVNIRAWDAFLNLDDANTGASTATDKTGNGKSHTLKVYVGSTLFHAQLYADS